MSQTTRFEQTLRRLAIFDERFVETGFGLELAQRSALDAKTVALLQVAVSVAIGSSGVCLQWSVARAMAAGATKDEIADVLLAIAPVAGLGRVVRPPLRWRPRSSMTSTPRWRHRTITDRFPTEPSLGLTGPNMLCGVRWRWGPADRPGALNNTSPRRVVADQQAALSLLPGDARRLMRWHSGGKPRRAGTAAGWMRMAIAPTIQPGKEHSMDGHYDVIVIGTGAGGGTLARHLAPSGKRILLLERGDWLPREPENWSTVDVFVDGRYVSPDSWYDPKAKSFFQPQVHYFVGGATKLYGAALYRMRAEDFSELHHHDGISPAWPISYQDMEPYYTAAEAMYQVHGARGEDPTEPPASAPYPYPAVSHEPRIQQLSDDLAAEGFHPFHAPCGIRVNEADLPYSICVRCADCDGFPCPLHAKSDAEVAGVRPALEHANVTLVRNARVVKLETNPAGTAVTEVVAERDGETERYQGDIVVVACGAANSAKLLLASASDKHPHGLANGSDQVGRNFMYHDSQAVLALSKEPNPTVFQKTLAFNDFYFRGPDFDYPMGNIQMIGKSQAAMFRGEKPLETKFAPSWALRDVAAHAVDFWLSTEDLPLPDNRVTLGPDGGVHLAYTPSNPTAAKQLFHQLRSMLASLRMQPGHLAHRFAYMKTDIPVAGCAHQAGTVRFGSDPATSVLNSDCRAHELDNLYVVDTSFFPSISAVNPALTAMANAVRVGDHLLQRLGAPQSSPRSGT